jgi:hypothetical protein
LIEIPADWLTILGYAPAASQIRIDPETSNLFG